MSQQQAVKVLFECATALKPPAVPFPTDTAPAAKQLAREQGVTPVVALKKPPAPPLSAYTFPSAKQSSKAMAEVLSSVSQKKPPAPPATALVLVEVTLPAA